MAFARPADAGELVGFLNLQTTPSPAALAVYQEALDDALEDIESRVDAIFVEAEGFSLDPDENNYPGRLRMAVLLEAARLRKRSSSPEGVAGMSELGISVRILSNDADIERLIRRFLKMGGFS